MQGEPTQQIKIASHPDRSGCSRTRVKRWAEPIGLLANGFTVGLTFGIRLCSPALMNIRAASIVYMASMGGAVVGQGLPAPEDEGTYPATYTFEKAYQFQNAGEIEKAAWFYVNLFPTEKARAIDSTKALAARLDTVDMAQAIQRAFVLYGTLDPSIATIENGALQINTERMKLKGAWGDELIQKISDPNGPLPSSAAYNFRGLDKAQARDYAGAIEAFDKAIAIKATGQIHYNRAYSKSMIGDFAGAISDYDQTIAANYRLAEAYFERGYCKDQLKDGQGAIEDYDKAIELHKDYADAYNNRGFTRLKQEEYAASIKDFDKAIAIKKDNAGAYMNRGFAKNEVGDKKGACKDWQKALEFGMKEAGRFIAENCK